MVYIAREMATDYRFRAITMNFILLYTYYYYYYRFLDNKEENLKALVVIV